MLFTYVITMFKTIYIRNIHFRIWHLLHLMNLESNWVFSTRYTRFMFSKSKFESLTENYQKEREMIVEVFRRWKGSMSRKRVKGRLNIPLILILQARWKNVIHFLLLRNTELNCRINHDMITVDYRCITTWIGYWYKDLVYIQVLS